METLEELLAKHKELSTQIETLQVAERAKTIEQIEQLMADHGLTMEDIGKASTRKAAKDPGAEKRPVAPKYRNEATGETWSGRGIKPKWLSSAIAGGATLESFAI